MYAGFTALFLVIEMVPSQCPETECDKRKTGHEFYPFDRKPAAYEPPYPGRKNMNGKGRPENSPENNPGIVAGG